MGEPRSPQVPRHGSNITGSNPDLSTFDSTSDPQNITLRKRKISALDCELTQEISQIRTEMSTFLKDFKTANDEFKCTVRSDLVEIKDQVKTISSKLTSMSSEHEKFKSELTELTKSMEFHSKSQDDLVLKVESLSTKITNNDIDMELADCKSQIAGLKMELNISQQRERMNNLEIGGIPEKNNEDLPAYLLAICNVLGVAISKDDIIHIHRVPTYLPNVPKNIIAKLRTQLLKDTIISAIRKKKGISTTDIGITSLEKPRKIFVNEHLAPFFKKLYKKTRDIVSKSDFQHVWVRNGKIFVRKNDNAPLINIQDYKDLEKIK
ncbi:uncharacterized protein LOC133520250 [Cydia pomonella]|uniref:uncharacterized protein LOC133520250 n=1 Tax=Cydia pomonella TaxID=82600 RepID=UPI002ADDE595|nr:uncharacterized protein LOC133520250 [Cydia pomonella]